MTNCGYDAVMRLAHTMIRVRDLEASIAFYTEFLGLREVRRRPIGDEATLVFLTDQSATYHLELTYNHDGRDYELGTQFGHLAFVTDDLDGVKQEIERRGWWSRESKPEAPASYVFVRDPDGYDVEILQSK